METNFYVYIKYRENGDPFYVGKGKGRRATTHDYLASKNRHYNRHLANIIRKERTRTEIVSTELSEEQAYLIEKFFISMFGRYGFGGILVNLTEGGEGGSNPSPETRAKMTVSHLGNKSAKGCNKQRHSEEHKAKMRERMSGEGNPMYGIPSPIPKGQKRDPSVGAKISASKKGHSVSEETRAKIAATLRSKRQS